MTDSKAGLVFTLDESCATLRAMAHKGPLTDTARVRKMGRRWTKVQGDDILLSSFANEDKPWSFDKAKN